MFEVEVPCRINLGTIHDKLKGLGAELRSNHKRVQILYEVSNETKGSNVLRIDMFIDKAFLVSKVFNGFNERKELTSIISDPESIHKILLSLGLKVKGVNKQEVWSYRFGDFNLDVKNINCLLESLEVERIVRYKKNIPLARKEIDDFISKNGFYPFTKEEVVERINKLIKHNEKLNFPALKRFLKI